MKTKFHFLSYPVMLLSFSVMAAALASCTPGKTNTVQEYEDSLYNDYQKDTSKYKSETFRKDFNYSEFATYIKQDTTSLSCTFSRMSKMLGMKIYTSEDHNFRIYSWEKDDDSYRFGGIEYICQFRTPSGRVQTLTDLEKLMPKDWNEVGEPGYPPLLDVKLTCSEKDKNGNMVYIVNMYYRPDTQIGLHTLVAYTITDKGLTTANVFPDGSCYASIEYENIADWYFSTSGLGWDWVNSYDAKARAVYLPHTDERAHLTDRYDVLSWEDGSYCLIEDEGGFWLYPELRTFKCLEQIIKTQEGIKRVDQMSDGKYRYTFWKKGKTMLQKPDKVTYSNTFIKQAK